MPTFILTGEATGTDTPFPYKRKHEFTVDGLPGVPFRKPSGYGVAQLKKIIESRDNIKVRIKEEILPSETYSAFSSAPSTTSVHVLPISSSSFSLASSSFDSISSSSFTTSSNSRSSVHFSSLVSGSASTISLPSSTLFSHQVDAATLTVSSSSSSFHGSPCSPPFSPPIFPSQVQTSVTFLSNFTSSSTASSSLASVDSISFSQPILSTRHYNPDQTSSSSKSSSSSLTTTAATTSVASNIQAASSNSTQALLKRKHVRRLGKKQSQAPVTGM